LFRAGYQFASGLGFSLDAGYVGASESAHERSSTLVELPDGLRQAPGHASDDLGLRALMFGASAAFHRGSSFVWMARLGGGVLVGSVSDVRTGRFVFNNGAPFDVGPYREVASMSSAYVLPEVRAGWRFANHIELTVGILGTLLIALNVPTWQDKNEVVTPPGTGLGLGRIGEEWMSGKEILMASATLCAR